MSPDLHDAGLAASEARVGIDAELLTRKEASDFLATLGVRLKPSTLARLWSTGGNGPPCVRHRNRPRYPREVLRTWAAQQTTGLMRSPAERSTAEAREVRPDGV